MPATSPLVPESAAMVVPFCDTRQQGRDRRAWLISRAIEQVPLQTVVRLARPASSGSEHTVLS